MKRVIIIGPVLGAIWVRHERKPEGEGCGIAGLHLPGAEARCVHQCSFRLRELTLPSVTHVLSRS